MTRFDPGDVVLVRFPFTDLATAKKRPALVLSPREFTDRYGDVVLLAMTSRKQPDERLYVRQWQQAGLPKPTWLQPLIATVTSAIIDRRLGALANEDRASVTSALRLLIAPLFGP